jgi:hypothetical protein
MSDAPPSALLRTYADRLIRQAAALTATGEALMLLADDVDKTEQMKVALPQALLTATAACGNNNNCNCPHAPNVKAARAAIVEGDLPREAHLEREPDPKLPT